MKITSYAVARPIYYDRNGTSGAASYQSYGLAPHAEVSRWAYTVSAGKKAYVEVFQVGIKRDTVATTVSRYWAEMFFYPSGSGATKILEASLTSNVAETQLNFIVGGSMLMFAGDQLAGFSADYSTGGTITVQVSAKYSQFDA